MSASPAGAFSESPPSVDFGAVDLGVKTTVGLSVTLDTDYKIDTGATNMVSGSPVPFTFDLDTCAGVTGPVTCNINVSFKATKVDPVSDTFQIAEVPTIGPQQFVDVPLSGSGIKLFAVNPPSIDYGPVDLGVKTTVGLSVTLDTNYHIDTFATDMVSGSPVPFTFDLDTCAGVSGPVTCNINVSFKAIKVDPVSDTFQIAEVPSGIGSQQFVDVPLSGSGIRLFAVSPPSIDYGPVDLGVKTTVGLSVTLDTNYKIDTFATDMVSGSFVPFTFDLDTCAGVLGPVTCNINVSFKANQVDPVSDTFQIAEVPSGIGPQQFVDVPLSGSGIRLFAVSPPSIDFGSVIVGASATVGLTVTLDTNYKIDTGAIHMDSNTTVPFSFDLDTCAGKVGPVTCNINVSFSPGTEGTFTDSFLVTEVPNGIGAQQFIHVPLSGTTDAPISASGVTASAIEGASFSGTVATFTDPDTSATASEYSATVDWGDGTTSSGTISGSGGAFTVTGTHTYAEEGSTPVTVVITDIDTPSNTATSSSSIDVADAALSATGKSPLFVPTGGFTGTVAHFTDADPGGTASDYTITIDWGDGTAATSGSAVANGTGFDVDGSHNYATPCACTISIIITDAGGASAGATTNTIAFSYLSRGAMVVGDRSATIGRTVTWWSPGWSSANQLSGGTAPSAFKGFAATLSSNPPAAGGTWTTTGGQSAKPPASVPSYMAIIVTNKVKQTGSTIFSGTDTRIAIVQVLPGYNPSIGAPGTGKLLGFYP